MTRFTILALTAALLAVTLASPVVRQEGGVAIAPAVEEPSATVAPEAESEPAAAPTTDPFDFEDAEPSATTEPATAAAPGSGACLAPNEVCDDGQQCCGGTTCTDSPWLGGGMKSCLPTPPSCYNEGQRNEGAEGEEYVPYAPCCDTLVSMEMPSKGFGKFCMREAAEPATVAEEPASDELDEEILAGAGTDDVDSVAEPTPAV